ncbi:4-amino-4-deoxy-L-arabinose transferase-like glycosyltransferase [Roseimicrobium gellanilyticum]|uniref:4-amino-4-deoxy-L-arabinose transferase-like glycosyltransferase n=1 Tax=Roseimicrobium gellanilyticum TaxID=748857 RepID=A0A366HN54_9BACT|nr:glycosyltransferase family 39 protein [Roseimicrobium gellanilyticum]RBP43651.1 4-amino-4-deoxy-L-arabinose transferase-like glycosyltransferase [Roseimicrobium gellanilyticum]
MSALWSHLTSRHAWLLLLVLTLLLYLPGTGSIPLMDRDEPRFARATVEMMQRGDWVIPWFNGEYRFDKPPLTYWWMRLHFHLLGVNELAARLHSVVSVWLVALVIFRMGRDLGGRAAGWWGAVGWITSLQTLIHGRLCVADMPMVLCVALAMLALSKILLSPPDEARPFSKWWWVLWCSLGLGFLAKGPIALLVPALALVLFRLAFWRKPMPWGKLGLGSGLVLALAMVAAWGIPALVQTEGKFWNVGMGEHVVKRGTQAFNGRTILPGYYLISAFLSLLPWMVFLPHMWRHVRSRWDAHRALLVAWFAAPQLIFLFYATQLPHYTMPGFAGFFVLLGLTLADGQQRSFIPTKLGRFGITYLGLLVLLSIGMITALWAGGIVPQSSLRLMLTSGAVMLGALAVLGAAVVWRRWMLAGVSLVAVALGLAVFGSSLRSIHPIVQMAPALRSLPKESNAIAWQYTEPCLVFYSDHSWTMLSKIERVRERMHQPRTGMVVAQISEWTLAQWWKSLTTGTQHTTSRDFQKEVEALTSAVSTDYDWKDTSGFNAARSSWVTVRVFVRKQPSTPSGPELTVQRAGSDR